MVPGSYTTAVFCGRCGACVVLLLWLLGLLTPASPLPLPVLCCAAAGGDQAKGLAAAIAVVSCEGGASAEAFAQALSQSISQDPKTGCTVLTTAKSVAYASCGPSGAFASSSSTISKVREGEGGHCGWVRGGGRRNMNGLCLCAGAALQVFGSNGTNAACEGTVVVGLQTWSPASCHTQCRTKGNAALSTQHPD